VNCREAERLIDTFFDGELDGRSMRDAAMHITRCKRCETELNDREQLQKVLVQAIDEEIAGVDMSRIWAAVEPTLDGARGHRLPGLEWRSLRLAAASSRLGGVLLGAGGEGRDDDAMVADFGSAARGGRTWRWSLAGGTALAASVLLALALVGTGPEEAALRAGAGEVDGGRVAAAGPGAPAGNPPRLAAAGAPAARELATAASPGAAGGPLVVARDSVGTVRTANKQVQVESVNFPRSSVAMWSEPATDTTVIWIEDEELVASGRR
jgi:hypothetical protein